MSGGFDELMSLAADLSDAPDGLAPFVTAAIKGTSMGIKKDWAAGAARTGLGGYAASIDFEITAKRDSIESEIGPNLAKNQGSFGFVEEANGGVLSAPQHAGRNALENNEEDFIRGLTRAAEDATAKAVNG